MNKILLAEKVNEKVSIRGLSQHFNLSYSTIRYWLKKYSLNTVGYIQSYNWEKENIIKCVSKSKSKSETLRLMGISTKSGNFQTLDKYCKKFSIDTTHFSNTHKFSNGGFTRKISNDDMFCEHSSASRNNVKKRIIKYKLLPYKCVKCINEGKWNGEKLVLQLEHQNGINDDNRLENLCFLCPNCHSQTKTFGSRNRKTKIIV